MEILQNIRKLAPYQEILQRLRENQDQPGLGLSRGTRLPVVSAIYFDINSPIVLVTDRADHALALNDELAFWNPSAQRFLFSEPNPLFYEDAEWGKTTRRERLQTLNALVAYYLPNSEKPAISPLIITSARALMTKTLPRRDYLKSIQRIQLGEVHEVEELLRSCIRIGYELVDTVLEPGQFCRRGGLIDLWSPSEPHPVRMDFFGNEIDTLRYFDPTSQRTIDKIERLDIIPAREYFIPNDGSSTSMDRISEFQIPQLHPFSSSLFDYLPKDAIVLIDDLGLLESAIIEYEEQAVKLRSESIAEGTFGEELPVPYFSWTEVKDSLHAHRWVELGFSTAMDESGIGERIGTLSAQFGQIERFGGKLKAFIDHISDKKDDLESIIIVSRQSARLEELWADQHIDSSSTAISFIESSLSSGFLLGKTVLFTDSEIFGWERPQLRNRTHFSAETPEMAYADLKPGDWIVHVDYGIGRYAGLVNRRLDGLEREFLCVEFQNNDQVFVPIHQADRLTRYIGPGGAPPSTAHLGTREWPETKKKAQEAVVEVARDLLDLYARRRVASGYSFHADTTWQGELESSFPYIETLDQAKALAEIKSDMESKRPMDRLLCGDVGYGKTEVALRAAFKAVMDGKQAAVLVPTTVLAQQHYETFQQRLTAFPVAIEMLSRFRTQREQELILQGLNAGAIDIVIGTHRLISTDVHFRDLGLVIIDEEQRFGVTHKERLKQLRTEVDVLTLTATPIPRTLYMALAGVRDISNLNTPPEERLPIVTHIGPYSPKLVRQAILRELERGGQIFFVHNRVQTIDAMRMHLEKLAPEARIAIAHGQMPEQELASVMHKFTNGDIDILLSTSIIESGLDIPNANTLIVDRGDTFGLAQLYQLRGRVGRGAARAYAYFFRHRKISPTSDGQERLEVIAENTQLGAGYSIAMRDLEMRGAGELLGTRQSGHIAAIGFHLYTRLLAAAVRTLRLTEGHTEPIQAGALSLAEIGIPVTVDLPLALGIPEKYVPDQAVRLRLYRRLADITDEAALDALVEEFADRFGSLPDTVSNLIFQMKVKISAGKAGLIYVGSESGQIVLRFPAQGDEKSIRRLPDLNPSVRGGKNAYWCVFSKDANWQDRLLETLSVLASG